MSKFCSNCGKEINEGQDLCLNCGHMINKDQSQNNQANATNGLAIAGFVLGIIGLFLSIFVIGIFLCIIGLILSIIGLVKAKTIGSGKGLAIAGTIINAIVIAIFTFLIFIGVFAFEEIQNEVVQQTCNTYGAGYKAVKGEDVSGSYYVDDWFCCQEGKAYNRSNCFRIDD